MSMEMLLARIETLEGSVRALESRARAAAVMLDDYPDVDEDVLDEVRRVERAVIALAGPVDDDWSASGCVAKVTAAEAQEGVDQPAPTPGTGDVWREVIDSLPDGYPAEIREAMEARRLLGIERYGVPLQRDNGRDHLRDLREELLDAIAYARAAGLLRLESALRWHLREVYGVAGEGE